ncbi:hypothetical protein H4R24_004864 [Coemansia sp. RSA 988]|nr:hypothetical protein H4R24_004864 [Coemansia sp. RSA 988]
MAAARQIVSYDDLFDDEAVPSEPISKPQQKHGGSNNSMDAGNDSDDGMDDDGCTENAIGDPVAWDDSDLIRAWDSTIKDYREFHEGIMNDETYISGAHKLESRIGAWSLTTDDDSPAGNSRKRRRASGTEVEPDHQQHPGITEWAAHLNAPQSEEDALYQLNMAWYYVGYYSACYQAFRSEARHSDAGVCPEPAEQVVEDKLQEPEAQESTDGRE